MENEMSPAGPDWEPNARRAVLERRPRCAASRPEPEESPARREWRRGWGDYGAGQIDGGRHALDGDYAEGWNAHYAIAARKA